MTQPNKKSGFFIGVTCPGCGGELELQADFFSLQCRHCGSVLRVKMPDVPPVYYIPCTLQDREVRFRVDRYLKKNDLPLTQSQFSVHRMYFPYWKVDGIRLQVREEIEEPPTGQTTNPLTTQMDYAGVFQYGRALGSALTASPSGGAERKIKVNLSPFGSTRVAGPAIEGIPHSIGMRADYIKAHPLSSEVMNDEYEYIPVSLPWEQARATVIKSVVMRGRAYGGGRANKSELFHPEGAIVYFPYLLAVSSGGGGLQRLIVDGVSGRVIHRSEPTGSVPHPDEAPMSLLDFGKLTVTHHRCANCGVDLPATESAVYICHNCGQAVSLDHDYTLTDGVWQAPRGGGSGAADMMLPFWSFAVPDETVADLARKPQIRHVGNRLIVPGFGLGSFDVMRRLSQRLTAAGQGLTLETVDAYDRRFRSVTVGLAEAQMHAEMVLYCHRVTDNPDVTADDFAVSLDGVRLFYLPFHAEHYFYVDSLNGVVTFEKNAAQLA